MTPREKWIDALRSGEYEQARHKLRVDGAYCCLGVLCDLAIKENAVNPATIDFNKGIPPKAVSDWLGMTTEDGAFNGELGEVVSLTVLNDARFYSFDQIADVIESSPSGMFK